MAFWPWETWEILGSNDVNLKLNCLKNGFGEALNHIWSVVLAFALFFLVNKIEIGLKEQIVLTINHQTIYVVLHIRFRNGSDDQLLAAVMMIEACLYEGNNANT